MYVRLPQMIAETGGDCSVGLCVFGAETACAAVPGATWLCEFDQEQSYGSSSKRFQWLRAD